MPEGISAGVDPKSAVKTEDSRRGNIEIRDKALAKMKALKQDL